MRLFSIKNFSLFKDKKIDAMLIKSDFNRFWASQFESSAGLFLITENDVRFLIDGRYILKAQKHFDNTDVKVIQVKDYLEVLFENIQNLKIKKLGIESNFTTLLEFEQFTNHHLRKDLQIIPVDASKWRQVKSEDEIEKIQIAADLIGKVFDQLQEYIRIGMKETDILAFINHAIISFGADDYSFPAIVASGINGANPHAKPSAKAIQDGEIITIDMGVKYHGYCSDMTRNICYGQKINDRRLEKIYHIVKEAQALGLSKVKPGVKCSDIDNAVRSFITQKGYGKEFCHGLGHGLGIEVHEEPYLTPFCDTVLEEGMVITVEPGIYLSGVGGCRIEDDVLVTKTSHNVLTKTSKDIVYM